MDTEKIQQECIKWFYSYLHIYDEELKKIINNQKYEKRCGYRHFSPIPTRMYIMWIISYLQNNHVDTKKMEDDFHALDKGLIDYREKFGDLYYKNVYCDFRLLVDKYKPDFVVVDEFLFESVITDRTYIEQLSAELKGAYDVSKDMARVRELDEILKDKIKESIKEKTYYPKDTFFAPKEYWWLHLEDKYGKFKEVLGIPEYEDVDPEPILKDCEKLLSLPWLRSEIRERIEKVYQDAKQASEKGTKVRLYHDYLSADFFEFTPTLTSGKF